jgi:predicted neuraminidase
MHAFEDRELSPAQIAAAMDGQLRPHVETDRVDAFLPSPMVQNHAANLCLLPGGDLACVWFGGTMEGMGDICIWMSTLPAGADRWTPARRMSDDPDRSEQNPVLFPAPDGRLFLFHTSQSGGRQDACEIVVRVSDDGGARFGTPRRLAGLRGIFVRQPSRLGPADEWLLPGFHCVTPASGRWTGDRDVAVMLVSRDEGGSFEPFAVPDSLGAVHMNPVEARGGVMPAFFRDRFARSVRRSLSQDGGLSWSAPEATDLPNNNSSIQATRLADGRIAIVMNPVNATMSDHRRASLYDELEQGDAGPPAAIGPRGGSNSTREPTTGAVWGVPRAPLTLAISDDGGRTFPLRRDLDRGSGLALSNNSQDGINRELSYPSILEGPDGRIHLAYTYHRRAIRYVRLDRA